MKTPLILSVRIALSMLVLTSVLTADPKNPTTPGPDRAAKRPKFSSKIHLPVQPAAEVTSLPPVGYELVFSDEFEGDRIDTQKWGFRLDSKMLSTQRQENVSVKDGNLEIALRKESFRGKDYTAGGVISRKRFVYGYYEARFKKYREAEAAVRAEILIPLPPLNKKDSKAIEPMPEDLN